MSDLTRSTQEVSRAKVQPKVYAEITAYTCGPESTGKYPGHPDFCRTASGYVLKEGDAGKVVAADTRYYPIGTKLYIPNVGVVTVKDTGGAIKGPNKIDLFVSVLDTKPAFAWGRRTLPVTVLN